MASLIYLSAIDDMASGAIDFDTDDFKCMLVTDAYTPDQDGDMKRSDVTGEVAGAGYTAGGEEVTVGITKDTGHDRVDVALDGILLLASTITARGAVYYKDRGGAASADELVAYIDFGIDVTSTGGAWTLTPSTVRMQL